MTAPNVQSPTYSSEQIDALRQMGRDQGLSEDAITAKLTQAGVIQASGGPAATLGHYAGLAGRAITQGLGAAQNASPFGAAQRAGMAVAGIPNVPLGAADANQMGLAQPNTPGERVAVKGGEDAVQAVASGGGVGSAIVGGLQGIAGQGVAELGGSPLAQMGAQAVVGFGTPLVGTMAGGVTRALLRGTGERQIASEQAQALMQAGNPNASGTLGQVAQGGVGRLVQGGLQNLPGSNMVFQGALENQANELRDRTLGVAASIGPVRDEIVAGQRIQQGLEKGFIPKFRATAKQLHNTVDSYVAPESPVRVSSTASYLADENELIKSAPAAKDLFSSPFMQKWGSDFAAANEAQPEGLPFNVVKAMRSRLGDILDGTEMIPDVNTGKVKQLYGALTQDMGRTVQEVGGDAGTQAWNRANTFWRAGQDRIQNVLQPIMDKKTPELAFRALMSGTKNGGTILRSTMRSLDPEVRKMVSASVLGKMGMAGAGAQNAAGDVFSPDVYLTRWNSLSPVAKGALFDGVSPTASKDLDALAKAMEKVKQANKFMRNPPQTASNVAFGAILGGLGMAGLGAMRGDMGQVATGLAPLAIAAGAQQLSKRVFTNPKMINWLVKTTKFPIGMLAPQLAILAKDSQKWDPESKALAQQVRETLGNVDWAQVQMGQAVQDALPH